MALIGRGIIEWCLTASIGSRYRQKFPNDRQIRRGESAHARSRKAASPQLIYAVVEVSQNKKSTARYRVSSRKTCRTFAVEPERSRNWLEIHRGERVFAMVIECGIRGNFLFYDVISSMMLYHYWYYVTCSPEGSSSRVSKRDASLSNYRERVSENDLELEAE